MVYYRFVILPLIPIVFVFLHISYALMYLTPGWIMLIGFSADMLILNICYEWLDYGLFDRGRVYVKRYG